MKGPPTVRYTEYSPDRFLLLDCSGFFHRARFAFRDSVDEDDLVFGMLHVFLNYVRETCQQFMSTHPVFCWDSKHSIRREIYPEYKMKRTAPRDIWEQRQIAYMKKAMRIARKEFLPAAGLNDSFQQRGLEADDIIAAIAAQWLGSLVIISSDEDLFQCLATNVKWYSPTRDKLMSRSRFIADYRIHPQQWRKVKAIGGCISDSVPGIPGVAEGRALMYVRGELTGPYLDAIRSEEGARIIKRNMKLVSLPRPETVTPVHSGTGFRPDGFVAVCKELGLKQHAREVEEWTTTLLF